MIPDKDRWEIGSEFHYCFIPRREKEIIDFPGDDYSVFPTGRAALIALSKFIGKGRVPRLHLPSFFCPDVADFLKSWYKLSFFEDYPDEQAPRIETIKAQSGEVAMAVNFFGIRDCRSWDCFRKNRDDVILVEDHTHDPFSGWVRESQADFAFFSLRKTLPVPDGAILWSPKGHEIPSPKGAVSPGAYQKLEAMLLKSAYLAGARVSKGCFRRLQIEGEKALEEQVNGKATEFTRQTAFSMDIEGFRSRRSENMKYLLDGIEWERLPLKPLFGRWPEGGVPFNAVIECESHDLRQRLLRYLVDNKIYATVHWRIEDDPSALSLGRAIELSRKILTIPADQRYGRSDMDRILRILSEFNFKDWENRT